MYIREGKAHISRETGWTVSSDSQGSWWIGWWDIFELNAMEARITAIPAVRVGRRAWEEVTSAYMGVFVSKTRTFSQYSWKLSLQFKRSSAQEGEGWLDDMRQTMYVMDSQRAVVPVNPVE